MTNTWGDIISACAYSSEAREKVEAGMVDIITKRKNDSSLALSTSRWTCHVWERETEQMMLTRAVWPVRVKMSTKMETTHRRLYCIVDSLEDRWTQQWSSISPIDLPVFYLERPKKERKNMLETEQTAHRHWSVFTRSRPSVMSVSSRSIIAEKTTMTHLTNLDEERRSLLSRSQLSIDNSPSCYLLLAWCC